MADPAPNDVSDVMGRWGVGTVPPMPSQPAPDRNRAAQDDMLTRSRGIADAEIAAIDRGAAARNAIMSRPIHAPAQPKLQNIPEPPQQQFRDSLEVFKDPGLILATLGSLFTRAPLTAALNAGASAMEAFHKGDKERMELERAKWKEQMDKAVAQNNVELQKYNAAFQAAHLSVQERTARLQAIAAGTQDEVMKAAVNSADLNRVWQVLEARQKAQTRLEDLQIKERQHEESLSPENRVFRDLLRANPNMDPKDEMEALKQIKQVQNGPPEQLENQARMIAEYRLPPLGQYALRTQAGRAIMEKVNDLNPEYNAQNYQAAQKVLNDFTSGKSAQATKSFNVMVSHLDQLKQLGMALGNHDLQLANRIAQTWREQTGNPAPTNFDALKEIVGDEVVKAIIASGSGALGDREGVKKTIDKTRSPQQLLGVIETFQKVAGAQLRGLEKIYQDGTQRKDYRSKLFPETLRALEVETGGGSTAPVAGTSSDGWSIKRIN